MKLYLFIVVNIYWKVREKGKYYIRESIGVMEVIAFICFAISCSLRERVDGDDLRLEAMKE